MSTAQATTQEPVGVMARKVPTLSIIVPVFNEQAAIAPFLRRAIASATSALGVDKETDEYEFVFVDDGSTDATAAELVVAREHCECLRIVVLSRNFGKDAALTAGLHYARGAAVLLMDVDLQDPPELIPAMLQKWREGAKVVNAVRDDRRLENWGKRWTAAAFYSAYNRLAERPIPRQASDFRLLDRQVVEVLQRLPERVRFMKGLYSWVGFSTAEVRYTRDARSSGKSKWTFLRLWTYALDGITSSTTTPLRIWTYLGGSIALLAFIYALFIVVDTLVFGRTTPGYASLITVVLTLGGLNLVALGILGEYLGRIFNEVKARPLFLVQSTVGFEASVGSVTEQPDD